MNLISVGRTAPQLWILPPPQLPTPYILQNYSHRVTSLHHLRGPLPTVTTQGSTILQFKILNIFYIMGISWSSFWGPLELLGMLLVSTKTIPQVGGRFIDPVPVYPTDDTPCVLWLALPLSMVLNCSHAGPFVILYVAPDRSPHTPFLILHICPGTNSTWLNMIYTLSL